MVSISRALDWQFWAHLISSLFKRKVEFGWSFFIFFCLSAAVSLHFCPTMHLSLELPPVFWRSTNFFFSVMFVWLWHSCSLTNFTSLLVRTKWQKWCYILHVYIKRLLYAKSVHALRKCTRVITSNPTRYNKFHVIITQTNRLTDLIRGLQHLNWIMSLLLFDTTGQYEEVNVRTLRG